MNRRLFVRPLVTGIAALLSVTITKATDVIKANNTTNLDQDASWNAGVGPAPTAADVAVWDATVTAANTVAFGSNISWLGIRVANPTGNVIVNGGSGLSLTLGASGVDASAATVDLTLNANVALGAAQTWNVNTGHAMNLTGTLTGNSTLTKAGAGSLSLSNPGSTFTGKYNVTGGILSTFSDLALGATPAAFTADAITLNGGTLANMTQGNATSFAAGWDVVLGANRGITLGAGGGTLRMGYGKLMVVNGVISGAGALSHVDGGNLVLNAINTYSGQTTLSAGTTIFNNIGDVTGGNLGTTGAIVFGGGGLRYTGGTATTTRTFTQAAAGTFEITNAATTFTINGALSGGAAGRYLIKTGNGILQLTGTGDNSGGRATVNAGTLILAKTSGAAAHSLGANGNTDFALVQNAGVVQLAGTGGDQIYVNSAVQLNGGTFDMNGMSEGFDSLSGSGMAVITNTAAGASTLTVGQNGNAGGVNNNFGGIIRDGVGTVSLVKAGGGVQILSGANTYSGGTTISAGTLQLNGGGSLGSGPITNNGTLTLNSGDSIAIGSVISGAGGVNQNGAGITTLSGANTYAGDTNVNGGLLNLTGTLSSNISVNAGARLGGSGSTTGAITLNANSYLVVGAGTVQGSLVGANSNVNILVSGSPTGAPATVDLLRYTSFSSSGNLNFNTAVYRAGAVTDDTVNQKLTFTYTAANRTWAPTTGTNTWDSGTTASWVEGDTLSYWGDAVTFGATSNDQVINISGNVAPSGINVTNATNIYTMSGTGSLVGTGGLTKSGNGTLILATANSYLGQTIITGGTVKIGNNAALGLTGVGNETIVSNGATLDIDNGQAANTTALGAEIIKIAGTGVGGNGALINSAVTSQQTALGYVVLTADAAVGGAGRLDIRNSNVGTPMLDLAGHKLTKVGTNQFTVVNGVITPGDIDITNGTFEIEASSTATGAGTITIFAGKTLGLYGNTGAVTRSIVSNGGIINNAGSDATIASPITLTAATQTSFGGANTTTLTGNISGAGNLTKIGAGAYVLGGTNTWGGYLLIQAGTVRLNSSSALPTGTPVVLYNASTPTFDINGNSVTVSTINSGSAPDTGSIVQLGTGGGKLTVTGNSAVSGIGNLAGQFYGKISGVGSVEYNNAASPQGQWDLFNTGNDFTGNITISSGRLRFLSVNGAADSTALGNADNDLIFNGAIVPTSTNQGGSASMQITNGAAGLITNLAASRNVTINSGKEGTFFVWGTTTFNVNGVVGGGGNLRKEDSGTLVLLNTANNYGGETRIINGVVQLGASEVLPNTTLVRLGATDGSAPQLNLNGFTETITGLSSVNPADSTVMTSGAVVGAGALNISGSSNYEYGGVFGNGLGGLLRMNGTGTQTLSGTGDNSGGLAEVNNGILILAKTNSAAAHAIGASNAVGLTINGGTVKLAGTGGDQIYTATRVQMNGGTFDLNGNSEGFQALLGNSGTVTNNGSAPAILTQGESAVAGNTFTFGGVLKDGTSTVGLTKTGGGTTILAGANTYTGPTLIVSGTLAVTGSISGTTSVEVQAPAVLDVSGVVGGFALGAGQTLQGAGTVSGPIIVAGSLVPASAGTVGTLTFNSTLSLGGSSIFDIDAGLGQADLVSVTGSLTLGGQLAVTNLSGSLAMGNTFNLFDAASFSGGFTSYNLPALDAGLVWNTSNLTVDGTLSVVPEPGSAACLIGGLALLLGRRRRR